jgi:hypothetical protein
LWLQAESWQADETTFKRKHFLVAKFYVLPNKLPPVLHIAYPPFFLVSNFEGIPVYTKRVQQHHYHNPD